MILQMLQQKDETPMICTNCGEEYVDEDTYACLLATAGGTPES